MNLTRRQFLAALPAVAGAQTRSEWASRRREILANMQLVMGSLPARSNLALDIVEFERFETPQFTRTYITFAGDDNDRVPGYLLVPKGLIRPAPAVLCLHQTTRIGKGEPAGIGPNPNLRYAAELSARGYITLAPDYPNFGDYFFNPYERGYASATMKGVRNHMRAVDVLQSTSQVDAGRIASIGHSLGGHNTLFGGAFDERLRVLVTSCGFNSFRKYYGGNLTGWSHKGYMPWIAEKFGKDPARMPFDFPDVLAALAPRPVFINAPLRDTNFEVSGVKDCVEFASRIYSKVFQAADRLVAVHPDAAHEFPSQIREQAYQFLDRWLK